MNPDKNLQDILRLVLNEKQLINDSIPAIDIFDFDYFAGRLKQLHEAFPEPFFLHAMAMKANSLRGILRFALENGAKGSECASISEAIHAVSTGFKPENVVYDSPCKTKVSQREIEIITKISISFLHLSRYILKDVMFLGRYQKGIGHGNRNKSR